MRRVIGLAVLLFLVATLLVTWALTPRDGPDVASGDAALPGAASEPDVPRAGRRSSAPAATPPPTHSSDAADRRVPADGGLLRLVVLRVDGSPAARASITTRVPARRAMSPTTRTADAAGRATFDDLEMAGADAFLVTWGDGESAVVQRPDRAGGDLVVRLGPALRVTGRVEGPDATPIAGARCILMWPDEGGVHESAAAVESDASGIVRFAALPVPRSGGDVRVCVAARGFLEAAVDPAGDGSFVARLREPRAVRGRCVDEAGLPLADVALRLVGLPRHVPDRMSGHDGSFVVGIVPEALWIGFDAPGRAPRFERIPASTEDLLLGDVMLEAGGSIRGTATDAAGRALPCVEVFASSIVAPPWMRTGVAGADGTFEVAGLPAGADVRIQACVPSTAIEMRETHDAGRAVAGDTDVRVRIDGACLVIVRLVRDTDGTDLAVQTCTVRVTARSGAPSDFVVVQRWTPFSVFTMSVPAAGTFDFAVTASSAPDAWSADAPGISVARSEITTVTVRLREGVPKPPRRTGR